MSQATAANDASAAAAAGRVPQSNSFGQATPALLQQHLSVVRALQQQVGVFKQQQRAVIDAFSKFADETARAQTQAADAHAADKKDASLSPAAADASPAALSVAALRRDLRTSISDLFNSHNAIHGALTDKSPSVVVNGQLLSKKDMFDQLDSRYYNVSLDLPAGVSRSDPRHIVNADVFGQGSDAAKYRNVQSTLAVLTPNLGRDSDAATAAPKQNGTAVLSNADDHMVDSSSAAPAATPLLPQSVAAFNLHSALLLNLVQCSGVNPFEAVQRKIRRDYVLHSPDAPVKRESSALPAEQCVSALDDALLSYLSLQHDRCNAIAQSQDAQHNQLMRQFRESQKSAVPLLSAAAAADAATRAIPRPAPPALPFLRKVFRPAATASPYAPSAGSLGFNPIAGLIFSLPHVLHAYIEFDDDDDDDDAAPGDASPFAVLGRSFSVPRLSVVHFSELSSLVDAHSQSAFHLMRDVAAQLTAQLWTIRQKADERSDFDAHPRTLAATKQLHVLQELMLLVSSYFDIYSRACSHCKTILSVSAASPLAFAQFSGRDGLAPLPLDASGVLLQPTVRLRNATHTQYDALHKGCVDEFLHWQATKAT